MLSICRYSNEDLYRMHQAFLNDPIRLGFIRHITHLYEMAPIKRLIVDINAKQIVKTELNEWYQIQIDYCSKKLLNYEQENYSHIINYENVD